MAGKRKLGSLFHSWLRLFLNKNKSQIEASLADIFSFQMIINVIDLSLCKTHKWNSTILKKSFYLQVLRENIRYVIAALRKQF